MKLDATTCEKAAMVNFAAMWLFARVVGMNAKTLERADGITSQAHREAGYLALIRDARRIAAGEDVEP